MTGKTYTALGLMSGTSLDGVDAALLRTDGETIFGFGCVEAAQNVVPGPNVYSGTYSVRDREELKYATKAALGWQFEGPMPNLLYRAEGIVDSNHSIAVNALFDRFNLETEEYEPAVDIIGYHGQTVLHHPATDGKTGKTLQLGNGQVLADQFGVPCVYDFRTADVKSGGQGAPLAPIYHKALVEYSGLQGITAVLNLGGVGNVTLVGPDILAATDTGPANGPLDTWMEKHGFENDAGGRVSRGGVIDFDCIERWLSRDFFKRPLPRSADRYDFDVSSDVEGMSFEDGAATLCAYAVFGVKKSLSEFEVSPDRIIVCGGGRHNRTIMTMLAMELGCPVLSAEDVGWNADMIEAQAFAYLAVRSKLGLPISFPATTGVPAPMTGGKTAFPKT